MMQYDEAYKCSGMIWDAGTLLNLAATGNPNGILKSMGCLSYVVEMVRLTEVLYLRHNPEEKARAGRLLVNLTPLVDSGLLQDVVLTETEQETFVDLAQHLDDGEAMMLAAAQHRKLCMVTDERVVIRRCEAGITTVPILTTPSWLKRWAIHSAASPPEIKKAIVEIQVRAHYSPLKDPLVRWWHQHADGTEARSTLKSG